MTTTTNKGYTIPTVNGDANVWGTELNGDLSIIDNNMGGAVSISVAGNTNVTASAAQAQNLTHQLTGALTGSISYILPATGGFYNVSNGTSGAYSLTVITSAGGSTGIVVPQGASMFLVSDGTNIKSVTPPGYTQRSSGVYYPNGFILASSGSFSGVSQQIILLPNVFRRFRLTLQNVLGTADGANLLALAFGSDGGSTFYSTLYNYTGNFTRTDGTSSTVYGTSNTNILIGGVSDAANEPSDATLDIYPGSESSLPRVHISSYSRETGYWEHDLIAGGWSGSPVLMNACSISISTGNMSGTWLLEGLSV